MMQLIHDNDIDQQATIWVERLHDGLPPKDKARLQQWLNLSAAHRGAMAAARQNWLQVNASVDALLVSPQLHSEQLKSLLAETRSSAVARPLHTYFAQAAAVAACVLGLLFMGLKADYSTGTGEIQRLQLADGSVVTLNAGSAMDVDFSDGLRSVTLRSGEAFFEVAKDPSRPFLVNTDNGAARAVGTAFNVRVRDESVSVIVTEGLVDVAQSNAKEPVRLAANQSIRLAQTTGLVTQRTEDEVSKALGWRDQRLFFTNVAMAEFVDEMNRYSYRRLVIADSALSSVRVGGAFAAGDTPAAVTMLEAGFGVKAVQVTPLLTLLYKAGAEQS